jgi:Fe-S oxidoreductase
MKKVFAPGCGLMLYKPALANKIYASLEHSVGASTLLSLCCRNHPLLDAGVEVINVCPGCDRRFRESYSDSTTVSLWEILAECDFFPFPDYHGKAMTILDACPTRGQSQIHDAIRILLKKMNISLIEPEKTREKGVCCGDSFWGSIPVEEVKNQMRKRATEMPTEDVVVYCVSCIKSMHLGGRRPRYLVDLLFNEPTIPGTAEPDEWHAELDDYIGRH